MAPGRGLDLLARDESATEGGRGGGGGEKSQSEVDVPLREKEPAGEERLGLWRRKLPAAGGAVCEEEEEEAAELCWWLGGVATAEAEAGVKRVEVGTDGFKWRGNLPPVESPEDEDDDDDDKGIGFCCNEGDGEGTGGITRSLRER